MPLWKGKLFNLYKANKYEYNTCMFSQQYLGEMKQSN